MAADHSVIVILGPTASGKSAVADELAICTGAEILSVDSMQVYRGMDVGTAKPTTAQRARVVHHLVDLVEPNEPFTVAGFVERADAAIADAAARGITLIATGGTPLYYKALFEGLFDGPPADEKLRESLAGIPNDQLHQRLTKIDPDAALRIHPNDSRRMIRAIEVFELTGRPITSFQTDWDSHKLRHPAIFIGLRWEQEALNRRINARVKSMISAGWVDETRTLLAKYGQLSQTAAEATGYHELMNYLAGGSTLEDAIERIKIATRQLARKQMKWFKRFPDVKWLPGDAPVPDTVGSILRLVEQTGAERPIPET